MHADSRYKANKFRLPGILGGIVFVMLFLSACQEKIYWELEMENELRLIVDAKITDEFKYQEVRLSLPVFEMNGEEEFVSGAIVNMYDIDTNRIGFTEDLFRPGYYVSEVEFQGEVDNWYFLTIEVGTYYFQAGAYMSAVSEIKTPNAVKVSDDPTLYELYFSGGDLAYMLKLEMDWSHLPGWDTLSAEQTHATIQHYYFGALSVDVNELFAPARDRVVIPPGTRIVAYKESLSEGYANYLRGVQSETAWNGGLFDVRAGDPYTNLSNGALGYFAAVSVVREEVVFLPEE